MIEHRSCECVVNRRIVDGKQAIWSLVYIPIVRRRPFANEARAIQAIEDDLHQDGQLARIGKRPSHRCRAKAV
jgi:hypothetical protein